MINSASHLHIIKDNFKPNRRLTSSFIQFQTVSSDLNNDSRPVPDGTASQPPVEFRSPPLVKEKFLLVYSC